MKTIIEIITIEAKQDSAARLKIQNEFEKALKNPDKLCEFLRNTQEFIAKRLEISSTYNKEFELKSIKNNIKKYEELRDSLLLIELANTQILEPLNKIVSTKNKSNFPFSKYPLSRFYLSLDSTTLLIPTIADKFIKNFKYTTDNPIDDYTNQEITRKTTNLFKRLVISEPGKILVSTRKILASCPINKSTSLTEELKTIENQCIKIILENIKTKIETKLEESPKNSLPWKLGFFGSGSSICDKNKRKVNVPKGVAEIYKLLQNLDKMNVREISDAALQIDLIVSKKQEQNFLIKNLGMQRSDGTNIFYKNVQEELVSTKFSLW